MKRSNEGELPNRKRARRDDTNENVGYVDPNIWKNAREQVGEVFNLWEDVHGKLGQQPVEMSEDEMNCRLAKLSRGDAGMLALAACWTGFSSKVRPTRIVSTSDMPLLAIDQRYSRGPAS